MKCFNQTTPRYLFILLIAILLTLLLRQIASAQITSVRGTVTDAKTRKAIPFVSVMFTNTSYGASTDEHGQFTLSANAGYGRISISHTGYATKAQEIRSGQEQPIDIALQPSSQELKEVMVMSGKKKKYSNKIIPP
jgi:hypothetical protein